MPAPKPRISFGESRVDSILDELVAAVGVDNNDDLIRSLLITGLDMDAAEVDRLNLRIASQALAEMLESWNVFNRYNDRAKVTIFGSARTAPDHPDFRLAIEFGQLMAKRNWMAITGAGPGIMTAGIEGIGLKNSLGVSIVLPFEANAAPIIDGDDKLATYKYFFTRKLTFMKETDAFALFPGGFGTLDELFELLTLIQTGKSYPAPIVLLDHSGSTYWSNLQTVINDELLAGGLISEADVNMYLHTHDPAEAVEHLSEFYSTYHSVRTVGEKTIVRLHSQISDDSVNILNSEFADIIVSGEIEKCSASKVEIRDQDCVELPRLAMNFNKRSFGRLIQLIERLNQLGGVKGAAAVDNLIHDVSPEEH